MENISNKICLICHDKKNLPLTTESSQTTRDSRVVQIQRKEVSTKLPCGHESHYASIKALANKNPRCPIDRRLITSTPFCFVNTRKELLRSEKGGEIDNVREILSTGFKPDQCSLTEKQWEISAQLIKAGASTRNKIAHHQLGWMHQNGLGVEQSYAKALAWYRKAAEQGNAFAQNQLGWMHEKGLVVEQNYAEALTWYRKAADQGHAFAQNQLGWMHQNGLGAEQNYAEALTWYRKAADQGHVDAQNQLGRMHQRGIGVERSFSDALIWFRKAADQSHDVFAQNELGWMYQFGMGVEQNYAEALTWYRRAADQGHPDAQNNLGWMHQKGLGVEQNDAEALTWYRKAADQGYADAQNQLGWMHQKGLGVEKNYAEALIWYRRAADQGHADAENQLGWMHQKGMGVEQNNAEALIWYRKAADQGDHPDAQNNLGWMHEKGLGVEQNNAEALIWYRKAADQGHALPIRIAHVSGRRRRLKKVVCARQFMAMEEVQPSSEQSNTGNDLTDRKVIKFMPCKFLKNTILERGYGDIASGIKVLELLQHEYPEAEMSFIVEHFAETENELRRIVEMSTLPNVKTIILDGRGKASNHQQVRNEAIETLNEAALIFHAPAGLIEPLMNSSGEYSKKTLAVSEYDHTSGYSSWGRHGIKEQEMGFKGRGLYLNPSHRETTGFKNTTLERLFPTKDCTGKMPEDSDVPKKVLYFSYGHVVAAMNSMLRNAVINESLLERDIVFVTSLKMRIEEIEQIISKIYSTLHLTQPIKLVYEENGDETLRIIPKDADEQAAKTFNIVCMDCIEKEDFALLEQHSTFNYTSGDISTTNVLGFGKIPFVDCKKKASNYDNLHEKLIQFASRASRACKKSGISGLMLAEEIRNTTEERSNLIKHWENICKSLSKHKNKLPDDELKNLSHSLTALNSPAWLKFQGEFTDWLKLYHSADNFILSRTRIIIAKSFSPSWKAERYR